MISILFVDDEEHVLSGLRRTLRGRSDTWDMTFVASGEEALRAFEEKEFDVVVSDMKMPKMDGAELLTRIRSAYPRTIRLVLSAQAETDAILRVIGASHRYMSKPCDPDLLANVIERALGLRDVVHNEEVREVLSGVDTLPTLPEVYQRLTDTLDDPNSGLDDVAAIIETDVAMTAQVLKIMNSAFFGLKRPVSSALEAASLMGVDTLRTLVLGSSLFKQFDASQSPGFNLVQVWDSSVRTSAFARLLARDEDATKEVASASATGGILHEVGRIVLGLHLPDRYAEACQRAEDGAPTPEVEVFGADFGQVGAALMGLWGLPETVTEAVAYHRRPSLCAVREFAAPSIVHVAHALADGRGDPRKEMELEHLDALGRADRIDAWQELCEQATGESA